MILLASARDAHRERRYTDGQEFKNTQRTTGAGLPQDDAGHGGAQKCAGLLTKTKRSEYGYCRANAVF